VVVGGVLVISDGEFGDSRPGVRQLASGAEQD